MKGKKNNSKKQRKGINYDAMRCPYCGGSVVFRSADGIYHTNSNQTMLYVCSHYPECDAYVRVQNGTRIPIGSMANKNFDHCAKQHMIILISSISPG